MRGRLEHAAQSPGVALLLDGVETCFELAGDSWSIRLEVATGRITVGGTALFSLHGADEVWERLLAPDPVPGAQSVVHLVRSGLIVVDGDRDEYSRNLLVVRTVLDAARSGIDRPFLPARPLRAQGEYHRVTSALGTSDVYVERCGTGQPILALATAGSDTTQWHGLMTESDVCDRYELITVDLPWHGRSTPTFETPVGGWRLSPSAYTDFIDAAVSAIGLRCPILLGASMAGAAVVHAVANHPARFGGAVACQVGFRVRNRASPQLRAADINQSAFVPEWTYGLMNPASPAEFRKRVWWGYSSGGFGLYAADIDSYLQWDFGEVASRLTPESPHISVLSGAYDTTVTPAASRELAEAIPNASFQEMPELGHFPHAENPACFAGYLDRALDRVREHCVVD